MIGIPKTRGMEFQDLVCFNKALLSRQGWRLLRSLDSRIAKIMDSSNEILDNHLI
jgi:hypothetical protein